MAKKLYSEWKINEERVVKLKLRAIDIVNLERQLGKSPIGILAEVANNNAVPKLTDMLVLIQAATNKFEHGLKFENICDLYEDYIDAGNSMMDLFMVVSDMMQVSGIIPSNDEEEPKEENLM